MTVLPPPSRPTSDDRASTPGDGTPAPASTAEIRSRIDDAELDQWILTRLAMVGVDLGVLPEDDPDAPADQRRVLASVRRILRESMPVVSDMPLDPMELPPILYPAHLPEVREATLVQANGGTAPGEGG